MLIILHTIYFFMDKIHVLSTNKKYYETIKEAESNRFTIGFFLVEFITFFCNNIKYIKAIYNKICLIIHLIMKTAPLLLHDTQILIYLYLIRYAKTI